MTTEPTEIRLYGDLGDRFGRTRQLFVSSPKEAVRALCSTVQGFRQYLLDHSELGYRVLVGGDPSSEDGEAVIADHLHIPTGRQVIRIVPVYAGAKNGALEVIAGVVLVIVGTIYQQPWLTNIGISLILGGVSNLLTSAPPVNPPTGIGSAQREPSYLFGGPANTVSQGGPVPVGWGRLRVGGVVISGGIVPEAINNKGQFGQVGDGTGTMIGDGDTTPWVASVAVG